MCVAGAECDGQVKLRTARQRGGRGAEGEGGGVRKGGRRVEGDGSPHPGRKKQRGCLYLALTSVLGYSIKSGLLVMLFLTSSPTVVTNMLGQVDM